MHGTIIGASVNQGATLGRKLLLSRANCCGLFLSFSSIVINFSIVLEAFHGISLTLLRHGGSSALPKHLSCIWVYKDQGRLDAGTYMIFNLLLYKALLDSHYGFQGYILQWTSL
jgi:hypothetical protein